MEKLECTKKILSTDKPQELLGLNGCVIYGTYLLNL